MKRVLWVVEEWAAEDGVWVPWIPVHAEIAFLTREGARAAAKKHSWIKTRVRKYVPEDEK